MTVPNFNAASRAHTILSTAAKQVPNTPTLQVWATVFDVSSTSPLLKIFEIAHLVNLLYEQLEQVRYQMRSQKISAEKYNPIIDRLQKALNLDAPASAWDGYRNNLHLYTLDMLGQYADLLDSEGDPISEDVLTELSDIVSDLEEELQASDLSHAARMFFERHIQILQNALHAYKVQGDAAFNEAFAQAVAWTAANVETVNQEHVAQKFMPLVKKVGEAWSTIHKYSPHLQTVLSIYQVGEVAYQIGRVVGLLPG